jgi:hypothetical protein
MANRKTIVMVTATGGEVTRKAEQEAVARGASGAERSMAWGQATSAHD